MSADKKKSKIPPDMSVGFIGAGRMAQAMARGFISTGMIFRWPFILLGLFILI